MRTVDVIPNTTRSRSAPDTTQMRTIYIQTKHRVDFNFSLSVKNMLEEGLKHDHIAVNISICCGGR